MVLTLFEEEFIVKILFSMLAGLIIGVERESRGKIAGIATQSLVIGGSMIFTALSLYMDPTSPARIAAQIVTGVGFLGAGIIIRSNGGRIVNLTTAASIWFAAAIGMSIGFGWYLVGVIATLYAIIVPRFPNVKRMKKDMKPALEDLSSQVPKPKQASGNGKKNK